MNEIHYKLGKTAPRHDSRTLKFESYITGALPPTPAAIDWTGKVPDFLMLGNDSVGNCLGAGARVLTANLQWIPVEQIKEGQELAGFDEIPVNGRREIKKSVVEKVWRVRKKCYDLTFEDGTTVRASEDHSWLRKNRPMGSFIKTSQMQCGHKKATRLSKFITVWDDENIQDTFDKGYLAGIFDGEGCLSKNKKGVLKSIRFSQRPGVVLDNVKKCLTKFGFKYSESIYSESALSDKGYNALLLLGGKVEAIRFLGLIRPFRLLQKLSDNFNLGKLECTKCKLISKIDVGDQEVIAIQTSTKTYIAEGLASHNCTCASLAHCEMLWTSQSTVELVPTTQQVLDLYSAITGYNPQDPNSDQGANVLDVLNYWRNTGFLNHKIQAYVQINPRNTAHVKAAVDLFGAVYTGIQVPSRAQDQFSNGQPWDDINPDEIEGGHAIPLVAYDPNYITCVTWGAKQKISYPWLAKYMDECYAVLSTDWIAANGSAPSGFNLGQLYTDLRLVQ